MPVCTSSSARFRPLGRRQIITGFGGGHITSDGGALFVRELDRQLRLSQRIAERFGDVRRQASCDHSAVELVRQRIFALALGYEDLNDHDSLREDLLFQTAVGRDTRLACRTTLGRFERQPGEDVIRSLHALLIDLFIEAHDTPPHELVLDFDATDDIVHGGQEGRGFNAYYDNYIFMPLYVFCGKHPLVAWLRPGKSGAAEGTESWLTLLTLRLRAAWPDVRLIFRADGGFAKPAIYRCCEALGVDYVIGLPKNKRLLGFAADWMAEAEELAGKAEDGKARVFGEFNYAAGSWTRKRRVIAKAEHNNRGENPRFVVTNCDDAPAALYEKIYCARGEMENRIKEQQLDLFADRTSSTKWWTNQLRLLYSTFAYVLLDHLRHRFLDGTELARAYVGTIRLKLLKIGAVIRRNTRRIVVELSTAYPRKSLFDLVRRRMANA